MTSTSSSSTSSTSTTPPREVTSLAMFTRRTTLLARSRCADRKPWGLPTLSPCTSTTPEMGSSFKDSVWTFTPSRPSSKPATILCTSAPRMLPSEAAAAPASAWASGSEDELLPFQDSMPDHDEAPLAFFSMSPQSFLLSAGSSPCRAWPLARSVGRCPKDSEKCVCLCFACSCPCCCCCSCCCGCSCCCSCSCACCGSSCSVRWTWDASGFAICGLCGCSCSCILLFAPQQTMVA
mmetsp:Transcript_18940/g.51474  ORF Transcript_18940/g.51474 Transcript_18940/m.51474 type:complete len:236 (-) Transcript_18940:86-793(-)